MIDRSIDRRMDGWRNTNRSANRQTERQKRDFSLRRRAVARNVSISSLKLQEFPLPLRFSNTSFITALSSLLLCHYSERQLDRQEIKAGKQAERKSNQVSEEANKQTNRQTNKQTSLLGTCTYPKLHEPMTILQNIVPLPCFAVYPGMSIILLIFNNYSSKTK